MDLPDPTTGQDDRQMALATWDALAAEHAALLAELERLRGQHPIDVAAHRAYGARLALHQRHLADWRARFLVHFQTR